MLAGELLEDRADEAARAAPWRPQVDHRRRRGFRFDLERRFVRVDDPGQRLAALAAMRGAALARPDAVLSTAIGARQDRDRSGVGHRQIIASRAWSPVAVQTHS